MQRFIRTLCEAGALSLLCLTGCAATMAPRELTDARQAYQHASASRASDLSPAELHRAKEALMRAEESWAADHEFTETGDSSYVAQRESAVRQGNRRDGARQAREGRGGSDRRDCSSR